MVVVLTVLTPPPVTVVGDPVEPILATLVLLLLHVPPEVASLREVVKLPHTEKVPVIAAGNGFTVTAVVYTVALVQPEPAVLTVNE